MRPSNRQNNQMRDVKIETNVSLHAEGSVLISFGNTKVLCTASVENKVPRWLNGQGKGWVTAEYGMLPRSTHSRIDREASKGKQSGRTQEIQRLIGRSLRAVTKLEALNGYTVWLDCDVIQADGGTRTAAITGAFVALQIACQKLVDAGKLKEMPFLENVAAISCGITDQGPVMDLDYIEDSSAIADANFVLTESGKMIEIQATAEEHPVTADEFNALLSLGQEGVQQLIKLQKEAIGA